MSVFRGECVGLLNAERRRKVRLGGFCFWDVQQDEVIKKMRHKELNDLEELASVRVRLILAVFLKEKEECNR